MMRSLNEMCTLILIAHTHTFFGGYEKLCYYDCGYNLRGRWYDKVFYVDPDSVCPVKLYDA